MGVLDRLKDKWGDVKEAVVNDVTEKVEQARDFFTLDTPQETMAKQMTKATQAHQPSFMRDTVLPITKNIGDLVTRGINAVEKGTEKREVNNIFIDKNKQFLDRFITFAKDKDGNIPEIKGDFLGNSPVYDKQDYRQLKAVVETYDKIQNNLSDPNYDSTADEQELDTLAKKLKVKPDWDTELPELSKTFKTLASYEEELDRKDPLIGTDQPYFITQKVKDEQQPQVSFEELSEGDKKIQEIRMELWNSVDRDKANGKARWGGNIATTDADRIKAEDVIIFHKDIQSIFKNPYDLKAQAQIMFDQGKDDPTSMNYIKGKYYLQLADTLIKENEEKVVPFIKWVLEERGTAGHTMKQMAIAYEEETGNSIRDVFNHGLMERGAVAKAGILDIRGELIPKDLAHKPQKIMEDIGRGFFALGNIGNVLKGRGGSVLGLVGRGNPYSGSDMESFASIEQEFVKGKYWKTDLAVAQRFFRGLFEGAPEFAAQFVGLKGLGAVSKALTMGDAIKVGRIGLKAAEVGKDLGGLASSASSATQFVKALEGAPALLTEVSNAISKGEQIAPILSTAAKTNKFLTSFVAKPLAWSLNNYGPSAMFQGYNPEKYSRDYFLLDSAFFGLDVLTDVTKAVNAMKVNELMYKDKVNEMFAKKYWKLSDKSWSTMTAAERDTYKQGSEFMILSYDEAIKSADPAYQELLYAKIKSRDPKRVIDKVSTIRTGNKNWKITYEEAINHGLIPVELSKTDYEAIAARNKSDKDLYKELDQLNGAKNKIIEEAAKYGKTIPMDEALHQWVIESTPDVVVETKLKTVTSPNAKQIFKGDVKKQSPLNNLGEKGSITLGGKDKATYDYAFAGEKLEKGTPGVNTYRDDKGVEYTVEHGGGVSSRYLIKRPDEEFIYAKNQAGQDIAIGIKGINKETLMQERTLLFLYNEKNKYWHLDEKYRYWKKKDPITGELKETKILTARPVKAVASYTPGGSASVTEVKVTPMPSAKERTAIRNELIKDEKLFPKTVTLKGGQVIPVRYQEIDGGKVGGRLIRNDSGIPQYILLDPEALQRKWKDRARMFSQESLPKVIPLSPNQFKTEKEWIDFAINHEIAHANNPELPKEGHNRYEDRINNIALGRDPKYNGMYVMGGGFPERYKLGSSVITTDPVKAKKLEDVKGKGVVNSPINSPYDIVIYDGTFNEVEQDLLQKAADANQPISTKSAKDRIGIKHEEDMASFLKQNGYEEVNGNGMWIKKDYLDNVIEGQSIKAEKLANSNINTFQKVVNFIIPTWTQAKKIPGMSPLLNNAIEGFHFLKGEYTENGKMLRQRIAEYADDAPLGAKEIADLKRFSEDVVDRYFPSVAEDLKVKITERLNDLSTITNKTLSNLVGDGNVIGFLKFYDPEFALKVVENIDEANALWKLSMTPTEFGKYRSVMRSLGDYIVESKAMRIWKYIVDTQIPIKINGKVYKIGMSSADRYKFGQTVLNIVGMPKMLMMNIMGMASEEMTKYNLYGWSLDELYDIKKTYGLLFDPGEIKQSGRSFFDKMQNLGKNLKASYDQGLYNFGDSLMRGRLESEAVGQAIEDVIGITKYEDFKNYVDNLSKDNRLELLQRIGARSNDLLAQRTGLFKHQRQNQIVFGGPLADLKRAAYRSYSLLAGWGIGILKSAARTIVDGMSSMQYVGYGNRTKSQYAKKIAEVGKEQADIRLRDMYMKNEDLLHLIDRVAMAMNLGQKRERGMQNDGGPTNKKHKILEALSLGMNLSYPLQGFQSTPMGREFLAFFESIFTSALSDKGLTGEELNKASKFAVEQFLRDLGRRTTLLKTLATSISKTIAQDKPWTNVISPVSEGGFLASWKKVTGGYLYYSSQDIEKNGYDLYIPKTSNSWLMDIIPYTDDYIQIARDLKKDLSMENLVGDPENYYNSRLVSQIPVLKERGLGRMANVDPIYDLIQEVGLDEVYSKGMLEGKIPWEKMGDQGGVYAFNILSQFYSKGKITDYYDDLRKKMGFVNDKGEYVSMAFTSQNQENLFTYQMIDALSTKDYDKFYEMFNSASDGYAKGAIEFLAFADTKSPGAGRELLSTIVQHEYYLARKQAGSIKLWETNPGLDRQIKDDIGKKYGNLLYVVDKPVAWRNMCLYYIKKNFPQYDEFISSPTNVNGEDSKNLSFTFNMKTKNAEGEEYTPQNYAMLQTFQLNMLANLAMNDPKMGLDGYKVANAISAIYMPKKADLGNETYMKNTMISINHVLSDVIQKSPSIDNALPFVAGTLSAIYPWISEFYKKYPEAVKNMGSTRTDTMDFFHGISDKIVETGKDIASKDYWDSEFGYSGSSSYAKNYPNRRLNQTLYDALKKMSYGFNYFKNYNGSYPSYKGSYYNSTDRDILMARGKAIDAAGKGRYANERQGGYKPPKEPEGRTPVQARGRARPFTKIEDPDKPTDWASFSTMKRSMKRRAIKFDIGSTRKRMTKGGLYKSSYQGGNRKRRVSRSKGGNSKGSKQHK